MKKKIDNLGRIVLPAEMKKEIGLENGSEAKIEIEDHKIIISKPGAIDYKAIVDKANNELITVIQIILEQPSNDPIEDRWLLDRLEAISNILGGNDE